MIPRAQQRRPFIAVEGPNGAGKTTLIRGLTERYMRADIPCVPVRNPGGTELGTAIREGIVSSKEKASPDAQLLAFMAGHSELVVKKLLPNEATSVVIFDRYKLSTIIYQGVLTDMFILPFLRRVEEIGGYLPEPDLYIVLQASGEVLYERSQKRDEATAKKVATSKRNKPDTAKAVRDNFEGDLQQFQQEAAAWSKPRRWVPGTVMTVDVSQRDAGQVLDHVWGELAKLWPVAAERAAEKDKGPMAAAKASLDAFL
jgi:dTMP kinase